MGATTGFREARGLGEAFDYGRRAPVRRSLVEGAVKPRQSLAAVLGRNALRRSGMGQGLVETQEDRPPPPGVIDEVYRDKRTGQRVSAERETAVEGIVRILQEKAKNQPTVINVGGEAKAGVQGGGIIPRLGGGPQTGSENTPSGDVLRRTDLKRSGQTGTQSGDVGKRPSGTEFISMLEAMGIDRSFVVEDTLETRKAVADVMRTREIAKGGKDQIEGLAERIKLSQTDENGNLVERLKAKLNQALTTPYNTPWSLGDEELLKNHDALAREVGSLEDSRKVAKLGKETIKRFGNRLPEGLRKLGKGFGPLSILSALKQIEKEELLDRYEKEIRRRKLKKE
ncbi:MAG: hypothetical protein HOO00_07745 [Rhodospirillaceae bacterium]|nr:hypothetical protein [Rhodospirillaceae bacterium]MBT5373875.1 hypothetical protein [Rhodospirillaceae bacterium]MBT5660161.1 hypothetical protein [Rhodospirillaceae bacterium]MBT5752997.1 hypothetical protein [Rhodospirillaceae bacterium]